MQRLLYLALATLVPVFPLEAEPPVAHWTFQDETAPGPAEPLYPDFPAANRAREFAKPSWIAIPDEGAKSRFDFDNGDEITVEAWVNPSRLNSYGPILSKGRTKNPGVAADNQNWAFRLSGASGSANVNFLFRSRKTASHPGDWHRWTSTQGFAVGSGWHHVAISYRFGDPDSLRGYLDGKEVKGKWDMGGKTTQPPVVDDDEVWIGSTSGGNPNCSFYGRLDEVALYRKVLPPDELKSRFRYKPQPFPRPELVDGRVAIEMFGPIDAINKIPEGGFQRLATWTQDSFGFLRLPHKYDDWGIREDWGKIVLIRANAEVDLPAGRHQLLVRSRGMSRLTIDGNALLSTRAQPNRAGAHHVVDPLPPIPRPGMRPHAMTDDEKQVEFVSPGGKHRVQFEVVVGGPRYRLEFGETSVAIASREDDPFRLLTPSSGGPIFSLTDRGWEDFRRHQESALAALDQRNRLRSGSAQASYWKDRHQHARTHLRQQNPPANLDALIEGRIARANQKASSEKQDSGNDFYHQEVQPLLAEQCHRCHGEKEKGGLSLATREAALQGGDSGLAAIVPGNPEKSLLFELVHPEAGDDRMPPKGDGLTANQVATLARWIQEGAPMPEKAEEPIQLAEPTGDATFLRRVYLDTVGVAPTREEARTFLESKDSEKRNQLIARLLEDPRWADNWVGYWQDVLAENPNLLKPNLNNTGPFRWWIHEAISDNKPLDRFATELILMRGSTWGGGTAGFAVASQNDVPMAAKAHVIASAFLGVEMKCARCHDAPYHDWRQADLFQMAAMLGRKPLPVPATSSVPAAFFEKQQRKPLIEVTLNPGATVPPAWPFGSFAPVTAGSLADDPEDSREELAAQVTASRRFAEVVANRVWARFMGAGIVEPVDDWEGNPPSDPALLGALADELISSGYDLKHLVRTILQSRAYQREAIDPLINSPADERYFAGPYRRRMSAEQVVDTAFHAVGRPIQTEMLTMDAEGTLPTQNFLNFGYPSRAWEFTTLGNERDRPSLNLPRVQAVTDTLKAFGWRNSRPEPITEREETPNVIQPGVLANGVMGSWLTRLTDESGLTTLAREESLTVSELVDELYLQLLTRFPTPDEKKQFASLLAPGFGDRLVPANELQPAPEPERFRYVTWSNHLNSEANIIKVEMEEAARRGDPPTRYLRSAWRLRLEDATWALLNAPEMILIP